MNSRSITCPTCAHGFAVPADARTAICPKCGRALPILPVDLTFSDADKSARSEQDSAAPQEASQLARISLRRAVAKPQPSAPAKSVALPATPAAPPAKPGALKPLDSTLDTSPTLEALKKHPPPLPAGGLRGRSVPPGSHPPPPPSPIREQVTVPDKRHSAIHPLGKGGTGVDLPARPPQADGGAAGSSPPSHRERPDHTAETDQQNAGLFQVEADDGSTVPSAAEQIVEDDWTPEGWGKEVAAPPSPAARTALQLADAFSDYTSDDSNPTEPVLNRPSLPGDPIIPQHAPGLFHADRSPSSRLQALSSAIDDEVAKNHPPRRAARDSEQAGQLASVPSLPSPPAASEAFLSDEEPPDGAPFTLLDNGIDVVLPSSPVEEVGVNRSVAVYGPAAVANGAVTELAPVSRRAQPDIRARSNARREVSLGSSGHRGLLIAVLSISALAILGAAAWLLLK